MKGRRGRKSKRKGKSKKAVGRMQRASKLHRKKFAQYNGYNALPPPKTYKPAAAAL